MLTGLNPQHSSQRDRKILLATKYLETARDHE